MKRTVYSLNWGKRTNGGMESILEKYTSFFKWVKRIKRLFKEGHSVLIYKPYKE